MPTLRARAKHVADAAALITGGNATHYWEETGIVGKRYEKTLSIRKYAWDVWFVYKPGVRWEDEYPPKPDFAMQQLRSRRVNKLIPRLDSEKFAEVVNGYLNDMEEPGNH